MNSGPTSLTGLRREIAALLEAGGLPGCRVTAAFPAADREAPLAAPLVAVGLEAVELEPGLGGFLAAGQEADYYGAPCTVTLRLDLYTPAARWTGDPWAIADRLVELLALEPGPYGFQAVKSGSMAWDPVTEANRLTVTARLRLALAREEKSVPSGEFRVARKDGRCGGDQPRDESGSKQ